MIFWQTSPAWIAKLLKGLPILFVDLKSATLRWNTDLEANSCPNNAKPISGTLTLEYCHDQGWPTPGFNNNFAADPRFVGGSPPPTSFLPGGATPPTLQIPDLTLIRATSTQSGSPCIDYGDPTRLPPDLADLDDDGNTTEAMPLDLLYANRRVDRHGFQEDDPPGFDYLDRGAYERP